MMYNVGKVAKVAGKRSVPSDALSYNVCIYLYYIYLYIYIYIHCTHFGSSFSWQCSLALVIRCSICFGSCHAMLMFCYGGRCNLFPLQGSPAPMGPAFCITAMFKPFFEYISSWILQFFEQCQCSLAIIQPQLRLWVQGSSGIDNWYCFIAETIQTDNECPWDLRQAYRCGRFLLGPAPWFNAVQFAGG